jgi:hypothetical protein
MFLAAIFALPAGALFQQAFQHGGGFLAGGQQFLQVSPGGSQFVFLLFDRITQLGELDLDFFGWSLGVNGRLESFHVRVGSEAPKTAATTTTASTSTSGATTGATLIVVVIAAASATTTTITAAGAHQGGALVLLSVHDFANNGFNDIPFGVIGYFQGILIAIQLLLALRRGVEISTTPAASSTPAAAAATTAATTATTAAAILCQYVIGSQTHSGNAGQHQQFFPLHHNCFLLLLMVAWGVSVNHTPVFALRY